MIGDFLYQLTARDQQSVAHEIYLDYANNAGNVTNLATAFPRTIPEGRILCLTHWEIEIDPGTGQLCLGAYIQAVGAAIYPVTPLQIDAMPRSEGATASAGGFVRWSANLWPVLLPGPVNLQTVVIFDSGTNSNAIQQHVYGLILPRGNVAI